MQKIMFDEHYGLETAVLERRKTKTRRIIKVPDTWHGIHVCGFGPDIDGQSLLLYDADEELIEDPKTRLCGQIMPRYKVGEIVAVAQSYKDAGLSFIHCPGPQWGCTRDMPGYNNKMFVCADLMPHQLRITSIRIERIQDISDEDCIREGVFLDETAPSCYQPFYTFPGSIDHDTQVGYKTPRDAFATLINKTSGKHTWEDNPYTFVYEFELIK